MPRNCMRVLFTLAVVLFAGYAVAQAPPADVMKVDYFVSANTAGVPDGTLQLTNPGTPGANICADIYVFDTQEEMSECCSCLLTPNGLRTLSLNSNLANNPLTGLALTSGAVYVVSASNTSGDCAIQNKITPTSGGVRAWMTHLDGFVLGGAAPSPDATLSTAEQNRLQVSCYSIQLNGSGQGICTCGTGD
jgi:hypothetical protein